MVDRGYNKPLKVAYYRYKYVTINEIHSKLTGKHGMTNQEKHTGHIWTKESCLK